MKDSTYFRILPTRYLSTRVYTYVERFESKFTAKIYGYTTTCMLHNTAVELYGYPQYNVFSQK